MKLLYPVGGALALLASTASVAAETPTLEEMWQLVQKQQAQIEALQSELKSAREQVLLTEQNVQMADQKIAASEQRLDQTDASLQDLVSAVPESPAWVEDTSFGGYGELHYNGGDTDKIDLHRFVLFFGHKFSDRIRFNSELEIEHALVGDGKPGEVELEQAYVEFDLNDRLRAKGGLFLVPVGMLNEYHEPPVFYGVERNPIESRIIPTTWWEAGGSLSGQFAQGLDWDFAVHSGLKASANSQYTVRSGRQKVAEAVAKDAAFTARIRYSAIPGLQLSASFQHQQDITQSADATAGSANLFETHAVWNTGGFGLKALYARWQLQGSGPESLGADVQEGYYLEPSYRLSPTLGVFARYNVWDNLAGDSIDSEWRQTDIGLNYWPHPDVVLKADYQFQDGPGNNDGDDRINLGIGYQF